MNLRYFTIVLYVLCQLLALSVDGRKRKFKRDKAPRCSRVLKRVPVHKDFNMDRFLGTWYDVKRTTWAWGDNTYESASFEFHKEADNTYSYSFTGQSHKTCIPVVSGILEPESRAGHFIMKDTNNPMNHPTLIISFTDYTNMAMVMFCFKYKPGRKDQCQQGGNQISIMSRSESPKKKDVLLYTKRTARRLCTPGKQMKATTPGLCKIPDILTAAKQIDSEDGTTSTLSDKCAVNNIQVQKNFSLPVMEGLWYEIARTRFTFNKMESVVSYHRYNDVANHINSYYTGTITSTTADETTSECMTAIQGLSKTVAGSELEANMMGRIGGEESSYRWAPMKVLYANDDYLMFYACYSGESNTPCIQQAMEVTLVGRTRDIDDTKRDSIYSILDGICIDKNDMIDTKFEANCSSWVSIHTDAQEIKPSDCVLDDIKVEEDYDSIQMQGRWYLYSSITHNSPDALSGIVMEKTSVNLYEVILQTKLTASVVSTETDDIYNCKKFETWSRDRCLDTANHISTYPTVEDGQLVWSKVLHLSESLLVEYVCTQSTIDGTCETNGVMLYVYTKNMTGMVDDAATNLIQEHATSVCLNPNNFTYETFWCSTEDDVTDTSDEVIDADVVDADVVAATDDENDENIEETAEEHDFSCDIDAISIFSDFEEFNQSRIYGYWYEIARSKGEQYLPNLDSMVAYFTSDSNQTLQIYYTGALPDTKGLNNTEIESASLVNRCDQESNGDYMALIKGGTHATYVPFKIIYTDYKRFLVTYGCRHVLSSGLCSEDGTHMRIWGRNSSLEEDARTTANDMIHWTCINPDDEGVITDAVHFDTDTSFDRLSDYILANGLDVDLENEISDITHKESESEENLEQKDEYIDSFEQALLMDDDEFYYGQ